MALNLDDPETESLAEQVARLTGESLTDAVRISLSDRLRRERARRSRPVVDLREIDDIVRRFSALPTSDPRSDEEIVGYDERGMPV